MRNAKFTRSNTTVHGGSYAGKHTATDNSGYTIAQTISNLVAGTSYTVSGWVNIPATSDAFTFKLQVAWLNAGGSTLRTDTVKTYSAATGGWNQATMNLVAPTGTTKADVRMVVSSLNATIYVDDFVVQAGVTPSPTNTATPTSTRTATSTRTSTATRTATSTRTPTR